MARLRWDIFEYQVGVDRGVIYFSDEVIPWNGIQSITERSEDAPIESYFVDGAKYIIHADEEEFNLSIDSYTYPDKLSIFGQRNESVGLCYRTMINETYYKLHLVYNASMWLDDDGYDTMGQDPEISTFTWEATTKQEQVRGFNPSAHLIIDSRYTPASLLSEVEDILYGTATEDPTLPHPEDLIFLFQSYFRDILDAGYLGYTYFETFDSGYITELQDFDIDGGGP